MAALDLRLRVPSPDLLALPWREPLATWDVTAVAFRDVPVGPSRHLVRFVEADDRLWALKDLPARVARREYDALRAMEDRGLAAVRAAGVVRQPVDGAAILVTHYLERSWQYRRLLMRVPATAVAPRRRLFEAMAALLVDLHRNGIYWGDCSLANTLFRRDGQVVQAWLVDAETAEFHPSLTDGQRALDLEIMTENVTGGLLDVAARRGEPASATAVVIDEARRVAAQYDELWALLHDEPVVELGEQEPIAGRLRSLEDSGFAIDEVRLEPADTTAEPVDDRLRLKVQVASRTFHADHVRDLTGLHVGPGQARILYDDLRADHDRRRLDDAATSVEQSARRWLLEVYAPRADRAHAAVGGHGDRTQAYCDLLEVRWLLSEEAGHDVGDEPALAALAARVAPTDSAANMAFVDLPTAELPIVTDDGTLAHDEAMADDRAMADDAGAATDEEADEEVEADGPGTLPAVDRRPAPSGPRPGPRPG